ncbi:DNA-directed RNA polymerase I subunit RPA49 [Zancudomyces culisetae]|uniref:DNA-directed RNA polymerase I subunit RPA49 n=1 Tax=Zancudomyces culisetae TaxID=1213189 RepID=A0A1R1PC38_ZANCU|nr:DNA-directed RNA polymerase I subunit RPA49 [Zancudomyces culisetae]|eukprot:OMH78520.1 DNA-directed RNA polymerase I subunit RPA49 [Zancudomyces culisetae]
MGKSKRKSLDTSNSNSLKIKLDADNEAISQQPPVVLGAFGTGIAPPLSAKYTVEVDRKKSREPKIVAHTRVGKMQFVGKNYGDEVEGYKHNQYLVGEIDRSTNTVTFKKASVVCFTSSVANLQDTAGEGQDSEIKPENYNEKRTDLGLTFGSKKRKTQLRATERNIIDVAEIKNSENSITTAVESRAAETADLDSAAGETGLENEVDRPIPVHNLGETQVPRVYDPKDYSPNNITRNCPTSQLVETGGDLEQLVKLLKVDSKITKYCKDKLLCYSAVLMLSLNDWKIDVSYFAREFGLKPSVATDYLRTIGCRLQAGSSSADSGSLFTTSSTIVNNLTNTDIDNVNENENENNDDDATQNSQTANAATAGLVAGGVGQGSVAILVAPLKFPSISKRKRR